MSWTDTEKALKELLKKPREKKLSTKKKRSIPRSIPSTKEVYFRKPKVYLYILDCLQKGLSLQWIKNKLDMKKNSFQKYTNRLKTLKFIKRVGYGTWELTRDGSHFLDQHRGMSLGEPKGILPKYTSLSSGIKISSHAIKIRIPYLDKTRPSPDFWDKKNEKLWNWIQNLKYFKDCVMEGTSKNIIVNLKLPDRKNSEEAEARILKFLIGVYKHFKDHGVELDISNAEISNQEHNYQDKRVKKLDEFVEKKKVYIKGKTNRKVLEKDKEIPSWSKICPTPFKPVSVETNDLDIEDAWHYMPIAVLKGLEQQQNLNNILPSLQQSIEREIYNKQLHQKVLEEMRDSLSLLNTELAKRREVDTLVRVMDRSFDGMDLECPYCHAIFSDKLIQKRHNLCPQCHRDLSLFLPSIRKGGVEKG